MTRRKVWSRLGWTLLFLAVAAAAFYQFWFLRQPDRAIPTERHVFVSPANGSVAAVVPWSADSLDLSDSTPDKVVRLLTEDVSDHGTLVSIEMDVSDVHYQRAPTDATFVRAYYQEGKFKNALVTTNEYGFRAVNEHNAMLFEDADGERYKVVQIAGLLARRIEDYIAPGERVARGQVIGLIKLGSQVSILLPPSYEVTVEPGTHVVDGESILARKVPVAASAQ